MADPIIRDMLAEQAYGPIYSSQYADAQKSARANEIARRIGIAPDLVEAALPDMMAEDRLRRASAEAQRNVAYARMMANPRLAPVAIDDEHLPKVAERANEHVVRTRDLGIAGGLLQYPKEIVKGFGRASAGFYGLARNVVDTIDQAIPDRITISGRNRGLKAVSSWLQSSASDLAQLSAPVQTDSRILNDIYSGAQSVGPSTAAMIAMFLTRNPAVAAGIMGGMTAGESAQEAREAGLSPIEALSYGGQQAVPEIGFELMSARVLKQSIDQAMPFARVLGRQILAEIATEVPTTVSQSAIRYSNIGAPKEGQSAGEWLSELPDEVLSTVIATASSVGFMTGGSYVAGRTINRYVEGRADQNNARRVDRIMEAAAQSSTRQTNPTDFAEALNQLVGDSDAETLYVPAEKVQELFQEGRELRDDPFWSQYAAQVEEASALGGDVVIPLATAATHLAGSPDWNALREHVRTRPGGASLSEVKQAPEDLEKVAAEIANILDKQLPQIRGQQLTRQFAKTLGYEGEQAEAITRLLATAMVRAHGIETAKRAARGEAAPTLERFAGTYLPQAARMTQAEYDAGVAKAARPAKPPKGKRRVVDPMSRERTGTDVITFIRKSGGIRDDEGHDLRYGRGYLKRPGLINKRGRSIDAMGEALWEAGYFGEGVERPSEAEVLDLIERGFNEKLYAPTDQGVEDRDIEGSEIAARERLQDAAENFQMEPDGPVTPLEISQDTEDLALEYFAAGYSAEEAVYAAWEQIEVHRAADILDDIAAEGVEGHDYEGAADRLRAGLEGGRDRTEQGAGDENYVPGFDEARDRELGQSATDEDGAQDLNQLFEEPDQPKRTMTPEQRSELEARLKQSMARRGSQESVKDQAGGLFSAERDQDTLFQGEEKERQPSRPISPEMLRRILKGGAAVDEKGNVLRDTQSRGNITIQRSDGMLMTGAIIRAFEAANFSTAVHELGHFFLEDLRRRALRGDATEQEIADWQAFKDWGQSELSTAIADDQLVPIEVHESWARGFERYIYEGNAPSSALRTVFARMRDFMMSLYRSMRSFNAPITPEIREVMDRLLASEDEIAARREEMRLGDEALSELMSAEEQAAYAALGMEARDSAREKLFESVLRTLRAEKTREARDRKREIKADVEAEVDTQPTFRALKLLRSGIPQDDGTTVRATLSREWLVDNFGDDIVERLPKGVPPIVNDDHAFDAETLANMAGFESADAMIKALEEYETQRQAMRDEGDKRSPRQALIEDTTDARYRDEAGDPFEDLEEEAEAALANERQADRLSMELRALSRKTGRNPTAWKVASEWARRHVRSQSAKEAISGRAMQMYARNASKAAQRVEEALVKQDYGEAFTAKQQQVLNLALMAQAKQAKDETDKAVRRLQKIANRPTIASVDQDYLDQAHQLLETVDMKTRPQTQVDKRLAFAAWHSRQVELGVDPYVPPEYRETLAQTNWSRMSIDDFLELDKTISQVIELGRLKQRLIDGKKERDFNEGVAEMQDVGGAQPPRMTGKTTDPSRSLPGRIRSVLRGIDAAMIKAETIAKWMDGGDPNGPWTRLIFRPMAEAQGREKDLLRVYVEDINTLIKGLPKATARSWERIVDTPELVINNVNHLEHGQPFRGTKDQIVMMAMNWGNEGNRQRLADGFGWDPAAVEAVFDRVLTKEDWDFVQSVWDTVDKLWPELAALERRVNGVVPEKVEATEVSTRHGTYRGGYFPVFYDPTQSTRAELDEANKLSPQGGWQTVTTRASSTKARAEAVKGRPLLLSMAVITRHMGEAIHDITHREAVSQVKRLLSDARIHSLISTRLGPEYAKAMGAWLENVARPNSAFAKSNPTGVALGRHLNKGVSLVGLGFRVTTALVQTLGLPVAAKDIGAKYLIEGMTIAAAHPVRTYNEIVARSAEMRSRFQTLDATIEDMVNDAASGKLTLIGPKGIAKYAFQGIAYMDMVVTTSVWTGAFNKALAENMSEEDAVQFADSVVRSTQGTGGMKDRAAIQREHPAVTALWPFFSYMNALYNMQRDVGRRFRNAETGRDYLEASRQLWWVALVPTLLQALIFGSGPDDDDGDVTVGDWANYLAKSVVLGNLGSIPLIGPIANTIGEGYSYRSSAYQQIGEGLVKGWGDAADLATGEDELKGATIKSVLTTIGLVAAKPLGQVGATSQGIYDYATGEAEPEDAGDWYELLTKGRISKEPTAAERLMGESE